MYQWIPLSLTGTLPEIYSILSLVPVTAYPPGIVLLTVPLSLYSYKDQMP